MSNITLAANQFEGFTSEFKLHVLDQFDWNNWSSDNFLDRDPSMLEKAKQKLLAGIKHAPDSLEYIYLQKNELLKRFRSDKKISLKIHELCLKGEFTLTALEDDIEAYIETVYIVMPRSNWTFTELAIACHYCIMNEIESLICDIHLLSFLEQEKMNITRNTFNNCEQETYQPSFDEYLVDGYGFILPAFDEYCRKKKSCCEISFAVLALNNNGYLVPKLSNLDNHAQLYRSLNKYFGKKIATERGWSDYLSKQNADLFYKNRSDEIDNIFNELIAIHEKNKLSK